MAQDVIITEFSNPTSEGVTIRLNKAARLKTGTGYFKEFWISWDKIGEALIDDYTEKQEVFERNKLRSKPPTACQCKKWEGLNLSGNCFKCGKPHKLD